MRSPRRRPRLAFALVVTLIWIPPALADDPVETADGRPAAERGDEDRPRFADGVEVVAPPIREDDRISPLSGVITDVSARQIDELGALDVGAALRRVPGIDIARYNPVGSYGGADGGAVYVRGHGSARPGADIGMFTDGIPRVVGVWAHPLLDVLDVGTADRIEVYRGAQPVLLGSGTFAAVNVVPRRVTAPGFSTTVAAEAGSFDTVLGRVEHGGRTDRADWLMSASRRSSNGHRPGAGGEVEALLGRVGVDLGRGFSADVMVDASDAWADDPGREGAPTLPVRERFGVRDTLVVASVRHEHGATRGALRLYGDDGAIRWMQWDQSAGAAFTSATDWRNTGLRLHEAVRFGNGIELRLGLDHDVTGGRSVERHATGTVPLVDVDLRRDAPWAAVSVRLASAPEVTAAAGVRYTDSREFGGHWGVQGGLTARLGPTELYATAARGVNLPGVWAASFYAQWGRGDGWRELEPERIDHVEVGAARTFGEGVRVTLALYRDEVENALRFDPPPPFPPSFANLGRLAVRGGELTVSAAPSPRVAVFCGLAHARTDPVASPNAPRWSGSAGVAWRPLPRLRLSMDGQRVGSQWVFNPRFASGGEQVGAYTLVNVTAAWRLGRWNGAAWRARAALENVGDEEYEVRPGYPMPGRSLRLGVEAEL